MPRIIGLILIALSFWISNWNVSYTYPWIHWLLLIIGCGFIFAGVVIRTMRRGKHDRNQGSL